MQFTICFHFTLSQLSRAAQSHHQIHSILLNSSTLINKLDYTYEKEPLLLLSRAFIQPRHPSDKIKIIAADLPR